MNSVERLIEVLSRISHAIGNPSVPWVVGGSGGLLLQGIQLPAPPRDLDLYVDEQEAAIVHRALAAYAVDEPAYSSTGMYRSLLSHYRIENMDVELVSGFEVSAGEELYRTEVRDVLWPLGLKPAPGVGDYRVVPLAHELVFNMLREREDRLKLIAAAIAAEPKAALPAFEMLIARNRFSASFVSRLQSVLSCKDGES
ncbi:hypothetical protein EBB07_31725 [Paenibacillaceae bacterium]|nr:hypothetical protein EBB07_31725 [Paenibacillaceae bacterium]